MQVNTIVIHPAAYGYVMWPGGFWKYRPELYNRIKRGEYVS